MKYSKNFERDWNWYLKYKDIFTFDGSPNKLLKESTYGKCAKHCFYVFDTTGKMETTCEPELLNQIFKCKGSINFQIKEWAQDRAKGYLTKTDFVHIIKEFELLAWMVEAVEKQKFKYYKLLK